MNESWLKPSAQKDIQAIEDVVLARTSNIRTLVGQIPIDDQVETRLVNLCTLANQVSATDVLPHFCRISREEENAPPIDFHGLVTHYKYLLEIAHTYPLTHVLVQPTDNHASPPSTPDQLRILMEVLHAHHESAPDVTAIPSCSVNTAFDFAEWRLDSDWEPVSPIAAATPYLSQINLSLSQGLEQIVDELFVLKERLVHRTLSIFVDLTDAEPNSRRIGEANDKIVRIRRALNAE